MANAALTAALSDLPPDLTTGARTQESYGSLERAGATSLHGFRMRALAAQRKDLEDAYATMESRRKREIAANLIGAAATGGLSALGAPAGLAALGGNVAGSVTGESPSALATLGPLGFSEAGRAYLSGRAVREAVDPMDWMSPMGRIQ